MDHPSSRGGSWTNHLESFGMRIDDLNRVRVLDEDTSTNAHQLRDSCGNFISSVEEFAEIATSFVKIFDSVGTEVEKQKIEAIGSRNLLQNCAKQRENQISRLAALIREKQVEQERLQAQYNSLLQLEASQKDFIEQFILQK